MYYTKRFFEHQSYDTWLQEIQNTNNIVIHFMTNLGSYIIVTYTIEGTVTPTP